MSRLNVVQLVRNLKILITMQKYLQMYNMILTVQLGKKKTTMFTPTYHRLSNIQTHTLVRRNLWKLIQYVFMRM